MTNINYFYHVTKFCSNLLFNIYFVGTEISRILPVHPYRCVNYLRKFSSAHFLK